MRGRSGIGRPRPGDGDLQILLGQADIATTQISTKVLEERLRALVEAHHPLAQME